MKGPVRLNRVFDLRPDHDWLVATFGLEGLNFGAGLDTDWRERIKVRVLFFILSVSTCYIWGRVAERRTGSVLDDLGEVSLDESGSGTEYLRKV